ncbi:Uncharacterized protein Adt_18588 [Abeliophyllum distichum]|uniref:Uncharacterized protein n=1 Tax=Abeliophyllum distichum TaxID=126358 RepID=A0ABD1TKA2_9LAMI
MVTHVQQFHTAWERALEVGFQSTHAQAIARPIDTFSDEGQRVATAILRALEEPESEDEPEDEAEPKQEIEPEPEVGQEVEAEVRGEIRLEAELESEPESTITSDDEAPPAKVPRVHRGWISEDDD